MFRLITFLAIMTSILFVGCGEQGVREIQEEVLFEGRYFEGTVYLAQSNSSPDANAIIEINIPNTEKGNDYMPIVFYKDSISIEKVGQTVYFSIYKDHNYFYADNLMDNQPANFRELNFMMIKDLVKMNFIDIHNTIYGIDHEQFDGENSNQISHIRGHLWGARNSDFDDIRSLRLEAESTGSTSNPEFRIFDASELELYGLKPICYSPFSGQICRKLYYIDKSLFFENVNLFPINIPQPDVRPTIPAIERPPTSSRLNTTNPFFKNEIRYLNSIPYRKITDVSKYHRH